MSLNKKWDRSKIKAEAKAQRNRHLINFISYDQFLIEKLKLHYRRQKNLEFIFSHEPMPENEVDCYVVAVELLGSLLERKELPATWIPVIAYGKAGAGVKAFLAGATDYLKEPWDVLELDFRLKKVFASQSKNYLFHEQELTLHDTLCSTSSAEVSLSLPESKLLKAMLKQRGNLVPRDVLSYALWDKIPRRKSRVMDVHISALRKKLRLLFPDKKSERFIYSAKGKGYILL